jgi:hypothetical protein
MKFLTIGDIHGRDYWKDVDPTKYNKIIFVGDYLDQFPPMTDIQILENFKDIIEFAKTNPDKVVLLLGNHDIQYKFLNDGFGCSGYRPSMAMSLQYLFRENKDLFLVAYQYKNYIWSHAGVTNGWMAWNEKEITDFKERYEPKDIAEMLNMMLKTKENRLLHQVSKERGGRYMHGGITWADRTESFNNYLEGYHQIVGHTPIQQITTFGDEKSSITYVDVLDQIYWVNKANEEATKKYGEGNFTPHVYGFRKYYELEIHEHTENERSS